ncbi:MAG: hypothetical protein ACR2MT_00815 [Aurantibacter sp.]
MEPNTPTPSDEIDLGQLLQLIRRGLNFIFRGILRIFGYLKRNVVVLSVLIVVGVAVGFLLNTLVDDKLQTEAIVKPNFASRDYLYEAVEELQANIAAKDTAFFKGLEIDVNELRNFRVEIEPIGDDVELEKGIEEENNKYLEILQNYKDNDFVLDVVKSEILKKSVLTHRLTFTHKNPVKGDGYVAKILDHINANPYYDQLQKVVARNATSRIQKNQELIGQIDELISNFSEGLKSGPTQTGQGMMLEGENGTDISRLLSFKSHLTKETEQKQIELAELDNAVSILHLGKTHVVKKVFFTKNIVRIPGLLLGLFFLGSLISYLNRKSIEMQ